MNDFIKKYYYLTPVLLGVLIFASDFLNTEIFKFGELNFAVWFVISLFCFACGWLINKTIGWRKGGKIVFAVVIAASVISIFLVTIWGEYFGSSELLTENLILFSLRNVTLGCMGFFGMAVAELLALQKIVLVQNIKIEGYEREIYGIKKEAELNLKESRMKAESIVKDAEYQSRKTLEKKERIEKELKEFIRVERELIKKYESI
jgi:hypothetical protein